MTENFKKNLIEDTKLRVAEHKEKGINTILMDTIVVEMLLNEIKNSSSLFIENNIGIIIIT